MRVGPSVWGPPSCEGLLCDCCVGVVNLTFSNGKFESLCDGDCTLSINLIVKFFFSYYLSF